MSDNKTPGSKATKKYARHKASGEKNDQLNDPRKELVEYIPLVKYIAGRLAIGLPRSVEMNDLVNAGVVGLIEAYSNFDVEKGVKFETYASLRIRGSILDELRGMDWAPRSTRARAREVERAMSKLEGELGRSPSEEEVAAVLEVDMQTYYQIIDDVSSASLLSLDEMSYGEDSDRPVALVDTLRAADQPSALGNIEREEVRDLLADSIGEIAEQERLVVALYYYEELTLKEIGQVLELSESRVSQLHTKAVLGLRTKLRKRFVA
ncbi:MAG: FliA/WhiG family RNA polymerase sigma factor [Candidatus Latescibacterota bacterium]|nr:FliA/WhiG family RNA polymerase sigma factor [Candidatus Latescibacterota bacterium]